LTPDAGNQLGLAEAAVDHLVVAADESTVGAVGSPALSEPTSRTEEMGERLRP
jgi:hypothetical protein